jgi:hypothetical protein
LALYGVLLAGILTTAGVSLLGRYLEPDRMKVELERKLSDFLQRPVAIGRVRWEWRPRPILFGTDVRVTERDGRALVSSPEIRIYPRLRHLLERQVFIQGLGLQGPTIVLRRSAHGETNIGSLCADIRSHMKPPEAAGASFVLRVIRLTRARFEFVDEGLKPGPLQTVLVADGSLDFPAAAGPVAMKLSADVLAGAQQGRLAVTGSLGERTVLTAASKDLPLRACADYEPRLKGIASRLALTASLVVTSTATRWSVDGRYRPAEFFPLRLKPAVAVDFRFRSDEASSLKAVFALAGTVGEIRASTPGLAAPAVKAQARFVRLDIAELRSALSPFLTSAASGAASAQGFPRRSGRWSLASRWEIAQAAYGDARAEGLTAQVGREPDGRWQAEAAAPRLLIRGERFALSTAAVSYEGGALAIPSLGFSGLGGRGVLGLSLKPDGSAGWGRRFEFTWHVADLDSARLLAVFGAKPSATGRLRSTGRLQGDRTELKSDRVKGSFDLALASGVISGVPGAVKVLSSLNATSLLRTVGGGNVAGLPFRVVTASCDIDAGVLRTAASTALHSATMDIGIRGSVDLPKQTIQADMVIQFLTVLDEVIRLVPGLKQILIGRKKSMFPIWAKLRGPLDDPQVTIQPVKSLRKDLWLAVKGVFNLPESLFSDITGAVGGE